MLPYLVKKINDDVHESHWYSISWFDVKDVVGDVRIGFYDNRIEILPDTIIKTPWESSNYSSLHCINFYDILTGACDSRYLVDVMLLELFPVYLKLNDH
ncbi:unnamed protein product [Thlaspi arvense]|uniref:Uncharacterized protein n=1 Tax=Thlaspi arvense TaxID=13288 RepID=A0AAU9T6X6_THLAR|nr:unnamed protein product [Thlaspi arvense]